MDALRSHEPAAVTARLRVRVRGLVQGVGFRPRVYTLAQRHALTGWVRNDGEGVLLEVEGRATRAFLADLAHAPPPLARIDAIEHDPIPTQGEQAFRIDPSSAGAATTRIGPDTVVCDGCLEELFDPTDRRWRYPFLNCTHCGPRYTITRGLPYDRPRTAMAPFSMCEACAREYADPLDRRFHAQPTACPDCGPQLSVPIETVVTALAAGAIVAIKGLGGYQLACDARDSSVVERLRRRKHRDAKPFAVMVASLAAASRIAHVDDQAAALLAARERPIVLLPRREDSGLSDALAPGLDTVGVMLPAAPLHYLLFHEVAGRPSGTAWLDAPPDVAWVMTSANPAGQPLVIDDDEARASLGGIADLIVSHDRGVLVRNDDSVVQADRRGPVFVRRARGYVPTPIHLDRDRPPVLALGGYLKTTICVTRGREAYLSQHVGDLDDHATRRFHDEVREHLLALVQSTPIAVAHDLHPDFPSTRAARSVGLPTVAVQHHHAHLAAVAAEHRHTGPLLGLALDGVGYGPDGTIWGGELLDIDGARYERLARLAPLRQPGGDRAALEPWRMAAAALWALGRGEEIESRFPAERSAPAIASVIERRLNTPETSSLGRMFDAAAALLGVATTSAYEGEAAMRLEALVRRPVTSEAFGFTPEGELDLRPLFERLAGVDAQTGAELFHGTLIHALAGWLEDHAHGRGRSTVALGGGCLLNRVLRQGLVETLEASGLTVLTPRLAPPGDGGLSLGQAWVAAHTVEGS